MTRPTARRLCTVCLLLPGLLLAACDRGKTDTAAGQPRAAQAEGGQPAPAGPAPSAPDPAEAAAVKAETDRIAADAIKMARESAAQLADAVTAFRATTGRLPTTDEGLAALARPAAGGGKPLVPATLLDDPWGRPFVYRQPGKANPDGFDVYSLGPDGRDGTPDDVAGDKR